MYDRAYQESQKYKMNGTAATQEVIQKDPGVILHLDFREAIKEGNKIRGDRWP